VTVAVRDFGLERMKRLNSLGMQHSQAVALTRHGFRNSIY